MSRRRDLLLALLAVLLLALPAAASAQRSEVTSEDSEKTEAEKTAAREAASQRAASQKAVQLKTAPQKSTTVTTRSEAANLKVTESEVASEGRTLETGAILEYRVEVQEALKAGSFDAARQLITDRGTSSGQLDLAAEDLFNLAVADQLEGAELGDSAMLERAAKGYRVVSKLRPESAAVHFNLAKIEESLGRSPVALEAFAAAADIAGPDQAFYAAELADRLGRQGDTGLAVERYAQALRLQPQSAAPHEKAVELGIEHLTGRPEVLLEYLWDQVREGEARRAGDAALRALARGAGAGETRNELLTVVAAALGRSFLAPSAVLNSPWGEGLTKLAADRNAPELAVGARQLWSLYDLYATPEAAPNRLGWLQFDWWLQQDDSWREPARGVWPRAAFRAALRAIGEWYRQAGSPKLAEACFLSSVDLAPGDTDPAAFGDLVRLYSEQNDVEALLDLAERYEARMFRGKGNAYRDSDLPKIYSYHRSLGILYGHLAKGGKIEWGAEVGPAASALFQLRRAYAYGYRLDPSQVDGPIPDPAVVKLLVDGLEATGWPKEAAKVREEAAIRLREAGVEERRIRIFQAGS